MNGKRDKKHEAKQRMVRNVKQKDGIVMPVPVSKTDLPDGYANLLTSLKKRIQQERLKAVLSANKALVMMYCIGILETLLFKNRIMKDGDPKL